MVKKSVKTHIRSRSVDTETSILEHVEELVAPRKMLHLKPVMFAAILIVTGLIGLMASFVLTVDKIHVLKDPSYVPNCNLNPVLSCGSVMKSNQAEIAGIPNTLFGIVGFSMVIAIGAALLAGARFHKRFWQLWMLGMTAGTGMMLYLMFQSIYRLGTLCIYCMSTWAALLPLIWYSWLWSFEHKFINLSERYTKVLHFIRREHLALLLLAYFVVIGLVLNHFWYYFGA